jgi:hypothetical protein
LRPGSRLVFPYYDLRPGSLTLLLVASVSPHPAVVQLEMYDRSCLRRDTSLDLSPGDVDLFDLGTAFAPDPAGTFQEGFVDAVTFHGDVLLGRAVIVNVAADWAISYAAAPSQRVAGMSGVFEPYPTRLVLPAFLAPGAVGPTTGTDGLLILAAPHPTTPGGELPPLPIQASLTIVFQGGRRSSGGVSGHQVIVPIGQLAGASGQPVLGWIDLVNRALDEAGTPIGLVGLYLQTVNGPGTGMAMATRLWHAPADLPPP